MTFSKLLRWTTTPYILLGSVTFGENEFCELQITNEQLKFQTNFDWPLVFRAH